MSSAWNIVFGIILIIIWLIAGWFITQASIALTSYKGRDTYLKNAYWYSFSAAVITWSLVALFILLVILAIVGVVSLFSSGAGTALAGVSSTPTVGISWLTIIFLVFALILVGITGVLSALAAYNIAKSPNYLSTDTKLKGAYTNCIIAAALCIGAGVVLLIGAISAIIVGVNRQRQIDERNAIKKEILLERARVEIAKRQAYNIQPQEPTQSIIQKVTL
jgi:hypothetical protein